VAGHFIMPSTEFNKTSANLTPLVGGGAISGGNGGDAGENALVPNFYYTQPLSDRLFLGIGVNAPFGLATEYDQGWVGRYHAIRSEIMMVNVNAAVAYKFNDQWSVGGGVNYQKLDAELTQAVDYGTICALAGVGACTAPGANESVEKPLCRSMADSMLFFI
jgi:long-chain fatty acid transport protein